jgi:WD40 repeat protein
MHREPSETLAYRLNLHRVIFHSLCCILFLLLAGCASSTASSPTATAGTSTPTATPTMAPTATLTPNIPTLSTALLMYKGHSKAILGFAWSPDAKEIVSGSDDGTVQMWDTKTGKRFWNYDTGTYVFTVAWSPDGKEVASGGGDGSVTLLNAATGKRIANYGSQADFIQGLAWSPDSKRIASSSQDGTVQIWRPQL